MDGTTSPAPPPTVMADGATRRPRIAHPRRHSPRWVEWLVPAAVVLLGALVLGHYSLEQWGSHRVPSWDLGIFAQLAQDYAHLRAPIVPIKGPGFNLLGDHFHPILVLLAPVWWLWPSGLALLITQDLLIAASAWPLTRLACRLTGPAAGAAVGLAYVLSWGVQGAVGAQFHEMALAAPLMAWAGVAFVEGRYGACAAWLAPLVFVKEDLGLTLLVAGVVIAWRGRSSGEARTVHLPGGRNSSATTTIGLALAAWGVAWFLLAVLVILPAFSPTHAWQYGLFGSVGDGTSDATAAVPLWARPFYPAIKLATLGLLAATAGIIGLTSPWCALMLPTLAWRFLAGKESYWEWQYWHYNLILMPIAIAALLDAIAHLRHQAVSADPTPETPSESAGERGEPGADPTHTPAQPSPRPWLRHAPTATIAVGLAATCLTTAVLAPKMQVTGQDLYPSLSGSRLAAAEAAIASIPQGVSVLSDMGSLAYVVPGRTVYWVGSAQNMAADYIIMDARGGAWGVEADDAAVWGSTYTGSPYELVFNQEGFQVAKRIGSGK